MRSHVLVLSCLVLAAGALWDAGRLSWLCDDAFISFRYAEHLAQGHGLVFNVGERVEGYTNFLWTLLIAGAARGGLAPEAFAGLAGLASFAGLLALMARTSAAMSRHLECPLPWLSLGLAGVALHAQHRSWATSGLETTLFTLLLTATVVAAIEARSDRGWLGVGLLGSLAALTRPEGVLIYALAWLSSAPGSGRARRLALGALPGILLLGPWLVWKLGFYGDLLPNTFYAKDADEAQWAEGLAYVRLYFGMYLGLLPGLAVALLWPLGDRSSGEGWAGRRASLLIAAVVAAWLVHVLKVGGDFMFARFLLPITPLLLLALERVLATLPDRLAWSLATGVLVLVGLARSPPGLAEDGGVGGVVEERDWYPEAWRGEAQRQGDVLRQALDGTDARVVYYGTQAMLMYYGDVAYALEGHVGLTDRDLARSGPLPGTRIGHGKKATLEYLRGRQIDLVLAYRLQLPIPEITRIDLGQGVDGRLLTYRREVTGALRERGARFVDFENFLDQYLAGLDQRSDAEVAEAYGQYRAYYFDHNDDPARQARFQARLGTP